MIISLSEIMSRKNKTERLLAPLELDAFAPDQTEYKFASKEDILIVLESQQEKIVILDVKTTLSLVVPCGRCLEDVIIPFEIQVSKVLDFQDTNGTSIREIDELNYIDGYNLDVDLLIFDEILLHFPLRVLCKPDCKGICRVCGANQNNYYCSCDRSVGDPRMAAIQDIFKNYKEV